MKTLTKEDLKLLNLISADNNRNLATDNEELINAFCEFFEI